ncbi:MAG: hypothetical protein HYV09_21910 [Deltaproteobacteria bacterium]|nr:hypothetical protein [Deltaproteobacteria bacterium]
MARRRAMVLALMSFAATACSAASPDTSDTELATEALFGGHCYTFVDLGVRSLGVAPGSRGAAGDINARGDIIGRYFRPYLGTGRVPRAFIWRDGQVADLGSLGGPTTSAADINDRGQVVGSSLTAVVDGANHAFLWERGTMRDLGTLVGHDGFSVATAINDAGDVVGISGTATGAVHAVLWRKGAIVDLGVLPGYANSYPRAINARGDIVGESFTSGPGRAFLYRDGVMTDLGLLPGYGTMSVVDVNDRGDVIGAAWSSDLTRTGAFLYRDGALIDLGARASATSSYPHAINARGDIVGTADQRAFLWTADSARDLGVLPGDQNGSAAIAINAAGLIAGASYGESGVDATPVVWRRGIMHVLPGPSGGPSSINPRGDMVGGVWEDGTLYPALWRRGPCGRKR